ncbi:MAG: zinc ribbon domain-containing protein [Gemmatimonadaceae bacterium]|nr:zinc ribbon domain-containing protein [Gemmatimonadaceae bacterium]
MDDLDRMFRRLVQNIRSTNPEYLRRPFEVAELYQNLIPYRHNRRELGIETNQDYELALCRLLSGERGYLYPDDALADAMRQELASPNPNTAAFREFAASHVSLSPTAERQWEALGGDLAAAPTLATPATPTAGDLASWGSRGASASAPAIADRTAARAAAAPTPGTCRYCGGSLPQGRHVAFCPHCGQNLTIQRCPACGTELELHWKFCITCGRGIAGS